MNSLCKVLLAAFALFGATSILARPADRLDRRPIEVCQDCSDTDVEADIAADAAGNFVVVWKRPFAREIWARRFAADGTPLGDEFRVVRAAEQLAFEPAVSMAPDGRFVVVWAEFHAADRTIYAQRFTANGARLPGAQTVSLPGQVALNFDVVMDDAGGFVIVWGSLRPDDFVHEAYVRSYGSLGTARSPAVLVAATVEHGDITPRVTTGGHGEFVVVWQQRLTVNGEPFIRGRRYDLLGTALDTPFGVAPSAGTSQLIADFAVASDPTGAFAVAFGYRTPFGFSGVYATRFTSQGAPRGGQIPVSVRGVRVDTEVELDIDVDADGDFVVAWNHQEPNSGPTNLHVRLFAEDGSAVTADRKYLYGESGPRDTNVAMDADGNFIVVWQRSPRFAEGPFAQRFAGPDDRRAGCAGYIATMVGTSAADTIHGTPGVDIIAGLGGNDLLYGGDGDDVLCGGAGNDQLFGEADRDLLTGSAGDDVLDGGTERDVCVGNGQVNADSALQCEQVTGVP